MGPHISEWSEKQIKTQFISIGKPTCSLSQTVWVDIMAEILRAQYLVKCVPEYFERNEKQGPNELLSEVDQICEQYYFPKR